jgi:hypothetical protein
MESIFFPEISGRNCHHSLRNNPEGPSSLWLPRLLHSVVKTEICLCVTSRRFPPLKVYEFATRWQNTMITKEFDSRVASKIGFFGFCGYRFSMQ